MAKSDSNKPETDSPKKVEKKGFFSRVARDVKNFAVGIASLPAHFATNPLDMGAKTGLIAASAIPVFGSIVTAVYAFKQSMRNEELGVGSVVKSLVLLLRSSIVSSGFGKSSTRPLTGSSVNSIK